MRSAQNTGAGGDGLRSVSRFIVPKRVMEDSLSFLREVGAKGYEGFVVWSGTVIKPGVFRFGRALVPAQRSFATPSGLLVTVDGGALFELNKAAYEAGELLGGQVHSHPTTAYHSATDDHHPLVTMVGALSVVVPDFAKYAPDDLDCWAWYRLEQYGHWESLTRSTEIAFE